jgi:hypothetical protein
LEKCARTSLTFGGGLFDFDWKLKNIYYPTTPSQVPVELKSPPKIVKIYSSTPSTPNTDN